MSEVECRRQGVERSVGVVDVGGVTGEEWLGRDRHIGEVGGSVTSRVGIHFRSWDTWVRSDLMAQHISEKHKVKKTSFVLPNS